MYPDAVAKYICLLHLSERMFYWKSLLNIYLNKLIWKFNSFLRQGVAAGTAVEVPSNICICSSYCVDTVGDSYYIGQWL